MNLRDFYQNPRGEEPTPIARADAPSTATPQANVEIRWPGMSQQNPTPAQDQLLAFQQAVSGSVDSAQVESTPAFSVDRPGSRWMDYYAGGVTGPVAPTRPDSGLGLRQSQHIYSGMSQGRDPNLTNPNAFSNGQPSGRTGSEIAPRPFSDVSFPGHLDPSAQTQFPAIGWNPGQADRAFSSDDQQSSGRSIPFSGGETTSIQRRIGLPSSRTPVVAYQDDYPPAILHKGGVEGQGIPGYVGALQAGAMPPTMSQWVVAAEGTDIESFRLSLEASSRELHPGDIGRLVVEGTGLGLLAGVPWVRDFWANRLIPSGARATRIYGEGFTKFLVDWEIPPTQPVFVLQQGMRQGPFTLIVLGIAIIGALLSLGWVIKKITVLLLGEPDSPGEPGRPGLFTNLAPLLIVLGGLWVISSRRT